MYDVEGSRNNIFQQITYLFENCKQCISLTIKPYLSRTQLQPLRTYLFRCSLVRFTIKNTIYSVIFRLVCSVFPHLLFRYFNLLRKYNFDLLKHCVFTSWPCPSARKTSEIKGQITSAA